MLRTIGIVIAIPLIIAAGMLGARAGTSPPANPTASECRRADRCVPSREELDGKAAQDHKLKTRHDTVKNSINNVR
ncbi:hypothetical protein [Kaistia sp. UC242_56]|uniref:hypothetical protein n=1 Tax=Kaistia sp. UC242_56 TaxID=3374625 RepID=UPI0037A38289